MIEAKRGWGGIDHYYLTDTIIVGFSFDLFSHCAVHNEYRLATFLGICFIRLPVVGKALSRELSCVQTGPVYLSFCPLDNSKGALRFAPICPFVCTSVSWPHFMVQSLTVVNSSYSFRWIFLKPCILLSSLGLMGHSKLLP